MAIWKGELARLSLPWHGLGALALGVLLARWSWVLFAPHATATAMVPEYAIAAESGQLFGVAASAVSPVAGLALPDVRLIGVFAARVGQPGFAVLKLDDKQQVGVAVGGGVVPGTKLMEVHPDYVLLERAGVQQRVNLEGKSAGAAGAGVVPAERKRNED
ncbi:hypothetical protein FGKAn22_21170 [Ferrigenium kumadai]|uniref:Type II secretion system protein GspC N-terminal domain-containing protein n=1 Tax=Ferrigenium kumadai TaxID=1682490 RepID=A0AAN1T262_9PROT|nr:type II secretion system protein N [Ferrigenium kumadai]BBJ00425.1 hypothetical protein FGKAn22_21170 [Ferrigenium kumadai]